MAKIITSSSNEIIKTTYKLLRDNKSSYIAIENINLITPAFCNLNDIYSLFCTHEWYDKNALTYKKIDNKIIIVNDSIIEKLSFAKSSQKILLVMKYVYRNFIPKQNGKYFILEMINDPGNLGTILRNAIAFGFDEIFINKNGVSILNEKVVRSSMGVLQNIKVNLYSNLNDLIDELSLLKINIFATAIDKNALAINNFELVHNYAIVLGNEAHGIEKKYLDKINNNLYIPISGVESLNVANACSIIMYQLNLIGNK